jgi:hypothetical protein
MAFEKGKSGNPKGRKKGMPNKTTGELRAMVQEVLNANFSKTKIAKDLNQLSPKSRLLMFFKLLEYTLPKPNGTIEENQKPSHSDLVQRIIEQMKIKG